MSHFKLKSVFFASILTLFLGWTMPSLAAEMMAGSDVTVKEMNDPKLGNILVDNKGMTLYTFTNDKDGISSCYDKCAAIWPALTMSAGQPVLAQGLPGKLGMSKRTDNTMQVTYNDMPLYHYSKDQKAGDTVGQGFLGKWYVVKPTKAK